MKLVVLAAFVVAVSSGRLNNESQTQQSQNPWPWQVGKLYRYEVESHTLAQHQQGESTGNAFRARFTVRAKTPGHLQAKLENPEYAQVHQELLNQVLPDDLQYQSVKNLEQPFEISVEGGRVLSLTLPSSLSLQHENLLKGLIGALQVDLSTHRVHSHHNNYDKQIQQGLFRKMETDVTGDCETLYSVSPVASEWRRDLPNFATQEDPIEITKTKNYGHCHHRISYHFGVPYNAEWTGTAHESKEDQLMKRATVSRILVGKQGPIYRTVTSTNVQITPLMYGQQKAEVHSHVKLTLVAYEQDNEAEWQVPEGSRVVQNLLYSLTSKQVAINEDSSSSSSSSESHENQSNQVETEAQDSLARHRRSAKMPKTIVAINKVIVQKRSSEHSSSSSSSSSSDSSSAYANVDMPNINEPVYAALYMSAQPHVDKKQNPMHAQKLVQEIAQHLQNPNNLPKSDFLSKFNILVRVIASMNSDQLSQTSRSIEIAKSSNNIVKADMWMIYRDAVAQAGTLPAFQQIKTWIQNQKMQGEEAAQVVATLVHSLRYPTKDIMMQFFQLATSKEVQEQMYLNSTALIAATRFINMGQVNNYTAHSYYPSHMYGRLSSKHDRFVLEQILPQLSQSLQQAIGQSDSHKAQVYIKAIGNLGHPEILKVFAPYIEGKIQASTYLRAFMVDNLRVLAHEHNHQVRDALYTILKNTAEPYEVRVAAIQGIFMTRPTATMMQTMALMTHSDVSIHVRAALKSSILSAAELKHPHYSDLAKSAKIASSMVTKQWFGQYFSAKWMADDTDYENEYGILNVLSYTGSEDSMFPKQLRLSLKSKTGGWKENSISATFSSFRQFVDLVSEQMGAQTRQRQQSNADHKYSAEKIAQMLNIKHDPQQPLEASFSIDLLKQERFYAFSQDNMNELHNFLQKYLLDVSNGVEKHYTKIFNQGQVSIMFPLASGMPFIFKYKEPTLVHMQGKIQGGIQLPSNENPKYSASFNKEIQFTFARNIDGSVGFFDTLSNNHASAGVVNKIQLNIPVKMQIQMQSSQVKIRLEPMRSDQDFTVAHYSVWPYTSSQKKDTLVPISLDPNTKLINRNNKVHSVDTKIGQAIGAQFHLQGYSYSNDYRNMGRMFQSNNPFTNFVLALRQQDVALTHYNFKYLGKQSQNKAVTFTAVYDKFHNQKQPDAPLTPSNVNDVTPNSAARRQELVNRVVAGINTAAAQVIDFSATFEGAQKAEYVLTAAIGSSPVDEKIKYALFVARNSAKQGNNQVNAVGTVEKPEIHALNFQEALKQSLKTHFEFNVQFGQDSNGKMNIQGYSERTQKETEALKKEQLAKLCDQDIARNNLYQGPCHYMIVLAHTPDHFKASVTYNNVNAWARNLTYMSYRYAQHFGFWYTDVNPYKPTADGKIDIDIQMSHVNNKLDLAVSHRFGEVHMTNLPIPRVVTGALSVYSPFTPYERVFNYFTRHQYQPYCTVDGNKIRTFSGRSYDYTLTKSWHVVMQDNAKYAGQQGHSNERLVILARRPTEQQQEIYISYKSESGQDLEIEIQPTSGSNKNVKVTTNAKQISNGDLNMYWDEVQDEPLFRYYTLNDGILMLNIGENRLRAMYDGQRLVVLANNNRNNIRGICGYMSSDRRDDYLTPNGIVDKPEHYAASYALNSEHNEPKTQELQSQAKQAAYQPQNKYTYILQSDDEWRAAMESSSSSSSSEEGERSQNVYRSRAYGKRQPCELQQQVQMYENHGEICITTHPLPACQSHCSNQGYKVRAAQVVCRPKLDQQFWAYKDQIRQGLNPQVSGVPQNVQYRVPESCNA